MYYIISSDKGTFLSILSENKFHTIDIILPNKVNSEDPQMLPTKEGHFVMLYHLDRPSGYIDVFEDTIKVIW